MIEANGVIVARQIVVFENGANRNNARQIHPTVTNAIDVMSNGPSLLSPPSKQWADCVEMSIANLNEKGVICRAAYEGPK
jgi:hypothetical protein